MAKYLIAICCKCIKLRYAVAFPAYLAIYKAFNLQ